MDISRPKLIATALLTVLASLCATGFAQQIWYVDIDAAPGGDGLSWATAFDDLHDGLAAAQVPGDEVWVAEGVYRPEVPDGNRAIPFEVQAGVAVYGGFRGDETILSERDWTLYPTQFSGDLNGNDEPQFVNSDENSFLVVRVATDPGSPTPTRVNGVIIGHGRGGYQGSGLSHRGSGTIELANVLFERNWGSTYGGGVYLAGGKAHLDNCSFRANRAGIVVDPGITSAFGGALCAEDVTELDLIGCSFVTNVAVATNTWGGALSLSGVNGVEISRCDFSGNESWLYGGGIHFEDCTDPVLNDCRFTENRCKDSGGAIHAWFSSLVIERCVFERNATTYTVDSSGGAIWAYGRNTAIIRECAFFENEAMAVTVWDWDAGGAIYSKLDLMAIEDCTFESNRTDRDGGALYLRGDATVRNCRFAGNWAGYDGAAMRWVTDLVIVEDCVFEDNLGGHSVLANFAGFLDSKSELRRCEIINNRSNRGIFAIDTDTILEDCTFADNQAVLFDSRSDCEVLLERCDIRNNAPQAPDFPGLLRLTSSNAPVTIEFRNGAIIDNSGRNFGLVQLTNAHTVKFTNCLISGSRDLTGNAPGIGNFTGGPVRAVFANCILGNNGDSPLVGTYTVEYSIGDELYPGPGNRLADPLFRNRWDGDYTLLPGSPAIDAGDADRLPPDAELDLVGNPRFVDDTGTANTGAGRVGWLDIGPYEFQGLTPAFRLRLDHEPVKGGERVLVIAENGAPDTAIYLFASTTTTGDTRVAQLDITLNLKAPKLIGPVDTRTDPWGAHTWEVRVPRVIAPVGVWLQAAQPRNASVVKWTLVNPE